MIAYYLNNDILNLYSRGFQFLLIQMCEKEDEFNGINDLIERSQQKNLKNGCGQWAT